jgi:hypothetical protein
MRRNRCNPMASLAILLPQTTTTFELMSKAKDLPAAPQPDAF